MLAMSPRTLQMRLREEDTSLRSLLDDVRGRLALRWLAKGIPRDEVSARLGFSESSAFRRACRRWAR
jgi:AraC-like DNA-binding protein